MGTFDKSLAPSLWSLLVGVAQPARQATAAKSGPLERIASLMPPSVDRTPLSASADVGVGQPTRWTAAPKFSAGPRWFAPGLADNLAFRSTTTCGSVFGSIAHGVGQPPKALPDVRRADARSAQIGSPDGISQCFQISSYSGEP